MFPISKFTKIHPVAKNVLNADKWTDGQVDISDGINRHSSKLTRTRLKQRDNAEL